MAPKASVRQSEREAATSVVSGLEQLGLNGHTAEHIYIEDELSDSAAEPRTVAKKIRIRNRVRGVITELTLYREGMLRVRIGRRKKLLGEYLLELRFLAPRATRQRRLATRCLWTALGLGAASLATGIVLPLTAIASYAYPAAILLATAAAVALMLFVYRSEERHHFRTATGRTRVVTLRATFGSIRRFRDAVREIERAIRGSAGPTEAERDQRYLRAEMQAHYRLAQTGVISREACSRGTALILTKFG